MSSQPQQGGPNPANPPLLPGTGRVPVDPRLVKATVESFFPPARPSGLGAVDKVVEARQRSEAFVRGVLNPAQLSAQPFPPGAEHDFTVMNYARLLMTLLIRGNMVVRELVRTCIDEGEGGEGVGECVSHLAQASDFITSIDMGISEVEILLLASLVGGSPITLNRIMDALLYGSIPGTASSNAENLKKMVEGGER